jgi:hypothetical protein
MLIANQRHNLIKDSVIGSDGWTIEQGVEDGVEEAGSHPEDKLVGSVGSRELLLTPSVADGRGFMLER